MNRMLALAALLFAAPVHAEVTFEWVTVGDPENACDTQFDGCFGSVAVPYRIAKHEVTNAQYAEFLNAVASDSDPNGLYNPSMGNATSWQGGIERTLLPGPGIFEYVPIAGRENLPVGLVSFADAARFANWLHNGQPTGLQNSTTTEDGAYTFTSESIVGPRNPGATIVLPSEDEWYKAAYYDTGAQVYFDYPVSSDTETVCSAPTSIANRANCSTPASGDFSNVGAYDMSAPGAGPGSPGPNGTYDQGGNAYEWTETPVPGIPQSRVLRGGSYWVGSLNANSWTQHPLQLDNNKDFGFRVAGPVPAMAVPTLSYFGLVAVMAGLVTSGWWLRSRSR